MRDVNASIALLFKVVVYLVLIAGAVYFSPLILLVIVIRAILFHKRPRRSRQSSRQRRPVRRASRQAQEVDQALRYGSKGTWMYNEAKRWGTDPRLYED